VFFDYSDATQVVGYFPGDKWYDFYNGTWLNDEGPGWYTLDAPLSKINVHVRGIVFLHFLYIFEHFVLLYWIFLGKLGVKNEFHFTIISICTISKITKSQNPNKRNFRNGQSRFL
jgi:hypothetical protein